MRLTQILMSLLKCESDLNVDESMVSQYGEESDTSLQPCDDTVLEQPQLSDDEDCEEARDSAPVRPVWLTADNSIRVAELRRHHSTGSVRCSHPLAEMASHLVTSPTAVRHLDSVAQTQDEKAQLEIIEFAAFCHARHVSKHRAQLQNKRIERKVTLRRRCASSLGAPHKRRRSMSALPTAYECNKARRQPGFSPGALTQLQQQRQHEQGLKQRVHAQEHIPSQFSHGSAHPTELLPLSPNTATQLLVHGCSVASSLASRIRQAKHQGIPNCSGAAPAATTPSSNNTAGAITPLYELGQMNRTCRSTFSFQRRHVGSTALLPASLAIETCSSGTSADETRGAAMSDDIQLAHPKARMPSLALHCGDTQGRRSAPPLLLRKQPRSPKTNTRPPKLFAPSLAESDAGSLSEVPTTPLTPLAEKDACAFANGAVNAGASPRGLKTGFLPVLLAHHSLY
ncbi:MAG: hypothetical protein MHM6MM_003047 [Cercozoa sp. M6MM]